MYEGLSSIHLPEIDTSYIGAYLLEQYLRLRATSIFVPYVRKPALVDIAELMETLCEQGMQFSHSQWKDIISIDILLTGRLPYNGEDAYIALSVFWVLTPQDVERAYCRAKALSRCGLKVYAAAAGDEVVPRVIEEAVRKQVFVLKGREPLFEGELATLVRGSHHDI